jgi:hypothetical protein
VSFAIFRCGLPGLECKAKEAKLNQRKVSL